MKDFLAGGIIAGFLVVIVSGILYFLPTIIAARKQRSNTAAIFLVNLFFGWTFLGWIVALVWAVSTGDRLQQTFYINGSQNEGGQAIDVANTKPCPYCAELIKKGAIKCRFCGESVVDSETENDDTLYDLACQAFQDGNYSKAKKLLSIGSGNNAHTQSQKTLLSQIEFAVQHQDESKDWYSKALDHYSQNELVKAAQAIQKSVDISPNLENQALKEKITNKNNAVREAAQAYEAALEHTKKGELGQSETLLRRACELDNGNSKAVKLLATVQKDLAQQSFVLATEEAENRRYNEAAECIAASLRLEPQNREFISFNDFLQTMIEKVSARRRRNIWGVSVVTLVLVASGSYGYVLYGNDEKDWETTRIKDTKAAYETYLQNHNMGSYKNEAETAIKEFRMADQMRWEQARAKNTIESYTQYLVDGFKITKGMSLNEILKAGLDTSVFNGKYFSQALADLDNLYWAKALKENSAATFSEYVELMPNGNFAKLADERVAAIKEATLSADEIETAHKVIRSFLDAYTQNNFDAAFSYLNPVVNTYFGANDVPKAEIMRNFELKAKEASKLERVNLNWSNEVASKKGAVAYISLVADWYTTVTIATDKELTYTNYKIFTAIDLKEQKLISIYRTKLSSNTSVQPMGTGYGIETPN